MAPHIIFLALNLFAALALIVLGSVRRRIGVAFVWVAIAAIIFGICGLIADSLSGESAPALRHFFGQGGPLFSAIALCIGYFYVCKKHVRSAQTT